MLLMLWFLAQLLLVVAMAALGPHLPQSPWEIVVLLVVGVGFLAPVVQRLFPGLRLRPTVPVGPPPTPRALAVAVMDLPIAPGTPGTPLVRAPARTARRFA